MVNNKELSLKKKYLKYKRKYLESQKGGADAETIIKGIDPSLLLEVRNRLNLHHFLDHSFTCKDTYNNKILFNYDFNYFNHRTSINSNSKSKPEQKNYVNFMYIDTLLYHFNILNRYTEYILYKHNHKKIENVTSEDGKQIIKTYPLMFINSFKIILILIRDLLIIHKDKFKFNPSNLDIEFLKIYDGLNIFIDSKDFNKLLDAIIDRRSQSEFSAITQAKINVYTSNNFNYYQICSLILTNFFNNIFLNLNNDYLSNKVNSKENIVIFFLKYFYLYIKILKDKLFDLDIDLSSETGQDNSTSKLELLKKEISLLNEFWNKLPEPVKAIKKNLDIYNKYKEINYYKTAKYIPTWGGMGSGSYIEEDISVVIEQIQLFITDLDNQKIQIKSVNENKLNSDSTLAIFYQTNSHTLSEQKKTYTEILPELSRNIITDFKEKIKSINVFQKNKNKELITEYDKLFEKYDIHISRCDNCFKTIESYLDLNTDIFLTTSMMTLSTIFNANFSTINLTVMIADALKADISAILNASRTFNENEKVKLILTEMETDKRTELDKEHASTSKIKQNDKIIQNFKILFSIIDKVEDIEDHANNLLNLFLECEENISKNVNFS